MGFDRERLDSVRPEIVESHIVDGKEPLLTLRIRKVSEDVGAPSMDVDRRRLREAMVELIGEEHYHFGSELTGVEERADSVSLALADGTRAPGDLDLGGDGIHSLLRDDVLAAMGACSTTEDVGHLVRLLDESDSLPTPWPPSSASGTAT